MGSLLAADGDGEAGQAPLGHTVDQAAGVEAGSAQPLDRLRGEHAVRAAAVGDDPGTPGQPPKGPVDLGQARPGQVPRRDHEGGDLGASMSDYLVRQLSELPNVAIRLRSEVVDGHGEGRLEGLTLRDNLTGASERLPAAALFVMIGAEPRTRWLGDMVARDDRGYILTGHDLLRDGRPPPGWPLRRPPLLLETTVPGVFAAGDVRHRSVKRVAPAVGAGAIAVQLVHEYLGG